MCTNKILQAGYCSILLTAMYPGINLIAEEDSQASKIDEIVVVARRREESLQSVPISVTAISADQLKVNSIDSGLDLQKMVPTLQIQQPSPNGSPGASYSLRGIRTGVLTYLSEVPADRSAIDLQMFDLSSVQVLAGPQGTLFGRNSTGGAILFVPQKPKEEFEASVEGRVGNYGLVETTASINIPVSDTLALRAASRVTHRDGIVENISGHDLQAQDRQGYRLSALFTPTESISNYTMIDYSKRAETAYAGIIDLSPTSFLPFFYPNIGELAAQQDKFGIDKVDSSLPEIVDAVDYGFTNILTVDFDTFSLKYIFSYRDLDSDQANNRISVSLPIVWSQGETYSETTIHELQLFGNAFNDRLEWLGGAYFEEEEHGSQLFFHLLRPADVTLDRSGATQASLSENDDDSQAVYAQASWQFTEKLKITLGGRYTVDDKTVHSTSFLNNSCGIDPQLIDPGKDCVRTLSDDFEAFTYMASLDYQVADNLLVYLTSRKGFRSGGFNDNVVDESLTSILPEYLTDFEIGLKADWQIGTIPVRTNLSAFHGDYEDIIRGGQRVIQTEDGPVTFSGRFNAAEATIYGGQIEFIVQLTDQLKLSGFYGYLHTEYDSFENPLTGDLSGNRFAQAPENTSNLSIDYLYPLTNSALRFNASVAYISEYTFDDASATKEFAFADGYSLVDLFLGWEDISFGSQNGNLNVGLYVKNATDEEYPIDLIEQNATFGFVARIYGDPRTYGLRVGYDF